MNLFKKYRFLFLFIMFLMLLVSIRLFRANFYKNTVQDAYAISMDSVNYISLPGIEQLKENCILINIGEKHLPENSIFSESYHIELKDLLKLSNRKLYDKYKCIILYSKDITNSILAKSILNHKAYQNIYLLDLEGRKGGNEVFKYKFQPDTTKLEF